jgi:hypothetical protein
MHTNLQLDLLSRERAPRTRRRIPSLPADHAAQLFAGAFRVETRFEYGPLTSTIRFLCEPKR